MRARRGLPPTVAALALGVGASWSLANVGPAAGRLADAYGVELPAIGLLTTALFVTHLAVQIPAGTLIDRLGARSVGLAALVLVAARSALALAAPDLSLALAARALTGLGTGAGFLAGSDYVRSSGGSPLAQGLYGGVSLGAAAAAVAVVPPAGDALGWRTPYLTALVLALAVVPLLALAPGRPPSRAAPPRRGDLRRLAGDTRLHGFAAIHAASFGLGVVLGNWVVPFLVGSGQAATAAGLVGSLTLFGGLVTRPLGGWLLASGRMRAGPVVALSLAAGAAGTAVLALPGSPLPILAAAAACVGLAAGLPFAAAFGAAQAARPDAPGAAIGLVNTAAILTIVVATPLFGLTFALPGEGRLGLVGVAVLSGLALLAVPRAFPREPPPTR